MDEKIRRKVQLGLDGFEVRMEAKKQSGMEFIESVAQKKPDIVKLEQATIFSKQNEQMLDTFVPKEIENVEKQNEGMGL